MALFDASYLASLDNLQFGTYPQIHLQSLKSLIPSQGFVNGFRKFTMLFLMASMTAAAQKGNDVKSDTIKGTAQVAFPISDANVRFDFASNQEELDKITRMLDQVRDDSTAVLRRIVITGYEAKIGRASCRERV